MPFKSEKQRRYLWKNHPEIAKRWNKEYGGSIQKAAKKRLKNETEHGKRANLGGRKSR
jgi:hypothetical protein